jgi:hypothetical protein
MAAIFFMINLELISTPIKFHAQDKTIGVSEALNLRVMVSKAFLCKYYSEDVDIN